ncbi:hypothetical protein AF48_01174 [Klebsiella aerogenes MGH 62]|nr:hypothetical protein AF48_01174 [Klebsiella aerogenes MGH 62]
MRRYPGILPRWRLRLPGLPTEYRIVARIGRDAPLSGNPPRWRLPGLLTEYRTVARIRRYAPLSGNPPRWRLRLPGLPTEYRTVSRIRRDASLSGNPPPVALTLTGATDRLPNRSPDKARCAAIREPSPGGALSGQQIAQNSSPVTRSRFNRVLNGVNNRLIAGTAAHIAF